MDNNLGFEISVPKNETLWVQGYNEKGELHYVITSTALRDRYFLYLSEHGILSKKATASNPSRFEKYILQKGDIQVG